ncbi:MAG: L-serine ammonia-lyase, iron-sulfur-dependent, subunit alpha, partial [Muribaculaceae bacterium]|nr:L-serine ammonia-lyase, iron-sulfur-dependent, subunit alpha [Muribaculaceae bacterium]
MKSIRELYRIGTGPSSSHTMGPRKAAETFLSKNPDAEAFEVTLFGSLAATGKGHMTDVAILDVLEKTGRPVNIIWEPDVFLPYHPNGMTFKSLDAAGNTTNEWTVFSVGGGAIEEEGAQNNSSPDIYDRNTLSEIMEYCEKSGRCYWEYVEQIEGKDINDFLRDVWETMKAAVEKGLVTDGRLPGPLNLPRKARSYYMRAGGFRDNLRTRGMVFSYALSVSEENASGGTIVTAPTC